jgi:DNA/RNA endonuclease G (NUC1)
MISRTRSVVLFALAAVVASCADGGLVGLRSPDAPQLATADAAEPGIFISELHYDNGGTDAGEAIEVNGPVGASIEGWSIVLYNGSSFASYGTRPLSGTIPATCGSRGVFVLEYDANGIQNGAPDGIALLDADGALVEFISYEGSFSATIGGTLTPSTDIGVSEAGSEPLGKSLQRNLAGGWSGPADNSFNACNAEPAAITSVTVSPTSATIAQGTTSTFTATARDAASQPVATTFEWTSSDEDIATVDRLTGVATGVAPGEVTITATSPNGAAGTAQLVVTEPLPPGDGPPPQFNELHYDNGGTDTGESIEVEGVAGTRLVGWSIVLYNGSNRAPYGTLKELSGTIPDMCSGRGVVLVTYPTDGIQNGAPDGLALVDPSGTAIQFLSYEGAFTGNGGPADGILSTDIGVAQNGALDGQSLRRNSEGVWSAGKSSFGACNPTDETPPSSSISFSGRTPAEPPLPIGFQDQLFATVRDGSGATITPAITWSSDTPAIASIDQNGVFTALTAGTAILRATTPDGTTDTWSLPTHAGVSSTTAQYEGNAEFGEPTDADASDDFILRRTEFTASYSQLRGIPNWVSYNLEASHFGPEDRCDCFTFDPAIPASFTRYTTADYTGAGAFHGYGIDRGHLARSADRTAASLDNAATYYFSNIIPQAADMNQGPWAIMENEIGDLARSQTHEVYVIAGASGSKGTVKNEGKLTIPTHAWKVAVIMPRDQGLAHIDDPDDLTIIAAIMPNEPGIRNVDWKTYRTSVDAIETLSGYDILALLPDHIESAVESGRPRAVVDGPYTSAEGSSVTMSAAGSSDSDHGDVLTYRWSFGDGGTATGELVSHTYANNGSYTVQLTAVDERGLTGTVETIATVANVAPAISFTGATIDQRAQYSAVGSFADPGADAWTGTVDYGDGSPVAALAIDGRSFALSHQYRNAGTFTVTVTIDDGDAKSMATRTVVVLSPGQLIDEAISLVRRSTMVRTPGQGTALMAQLDAARSSVDHPNPQPVTAQLEAVLRHLDSMVRTGAIDGAEAKAVRALIARTFAALGL